MTRFSAEIAPGAADIARLTDEVADFLQRAGVDPRAVHHVSLVIDEILTNIGTHGGMAGAPARIALAVEADGVRGEIEDSGRPFDPHAATPPALTEPAEERASGGLGLHLVRQLTTTLDYRSDGTHNWTTFCVPRQPARA